MPNGGQDAETEILDYASLQRERHIEPLSEACAVVSCEID